MRKRYLLSYDISTSALSFTSTTLAVTWIEERRWRSYCAVRLLASSEPKITAVACAVGYENVTDDVNTCWKSTTRREVNPRLAAGLIRMAYASATITVKRENLYRRRTPPRERTVSGRFRCDTETPRLPRIWIAFAARPPEVASTLPLTTITWRTRNAFERWPLKAAPPNARVNALLLKTPSAGRNSRRCHWTPRWRCLYLSIRVV